MEEHLTEEQIWQKLEQITGLSRYDLPDALPIENFYNPDTDEFDFDGISAW